MFKALSVALVSALILVSCATSPLGRQQLVIFSEAQMDAMGLDAFQAIKVEEPIEQDKHINAYVDCIANAGPEVITDANFKSAIKYDEKPKKFECR